jgi:low affinity Fe/Cu permease
MHPSWRLSLSPAAFALVVIYGVLWVFLGPETFEWHAGAALATWMMTVFIRRAEHRDMQAMHAKMDHLLERLAATDTGMSGIDRMQPEDVEKYRRLHPLIR